MKIEFILEPHETKAETSALIVADAIRKALSEEVYKKFSSYVKRHKFYVKLKDNTRTFRNFFKIKR